MGVPDDVIETIRTRGPLDGLDGRIAAIIAFGRELFGRHRVSPETYQRLADGLEPRMLVDLVNLMGMYAMTASHAHRVRRAASRGRGGRPPHLTAGGSRNGRRQPSGSRSTSSAPSTLTWDT